MNLHAQFAVYDPIVSVDRTQPGIFRWRAGFPIETTTTPISLGEGNTPVVHCEAFAELLGVDSVVIKDESRNPTSSYKDRLAAVAVTKAVEAGASTVVVASTGNHGAAAAAYAARAGLECVVLAARTASALMVEQIRGYGGRVIALPTIPDRWTVMKAAVEELGWFPISGFQIPPVGSPPFGIEGYKSIAFELHEQLTETPTAVVVPTAYGDGLTGIFRGFEELRGAGRITDTPRMIAAEALGPHAKAIVAGNVDRVPGIERRPTLAFSAGTPVGTHQTLATLRRSGGAAVGPISDDAVLEAQADLAREAGVYAETTSAMTLAAAARLGDGGALRETDRLVLMITSSGLKSTAETATVRAAVPEIEPKLDALLVVLGG
ncbi:pyridoxal-phosphate dependent enzyme [Mycobacterium sp. 21AC1]|uniref:pyridoxal-phosphate dependent enzyme n=1 Tax=[Mycobacterium] appelbergii TaxID=2939269 RepID=UPI0029394A60|nr:pyridoxal-phosphate dependent enzyme [Mycobacterium sp. 21AC1]MDV3126043.1 pyridoxal-phosphate dependent enzyme [Mycobacterium sp. 21AC1]